MRVNVCPMRECTHAHTHVGVVCKFLCVLELGTWVGPLGSGPPGEEDREVIEGGIREKCVCVCDISENLWL